jgi:hypothetical protein
MSEHRLWVSKNPLLNFCLRHSNLIPVATLGGPTMFARIGVMRALNRNVARVQTKDGDVDQ